MLNRRTTAFMGHFFKTYPTRSLLMVGLLIISGLAEGIGVVTLLPVLEVAANVGAEEASGVSLAVARALERIGLPASLEVLLIIIVIAMALKGLFRWLAMRQVGYTVAQVATDLRLRLIRALMQARWSYFTSRSTGQFANAISSEAHRAASAYREACRAMAGTIQVVIYLGAVILVSWRVAVLGMIVGVLILMLLRRFVSMSREAGAFQTRMMKSLIRRISEILPGIKPIKAMGREADLLPLLERETDSFNQAQQREVLASESMRSFQEPILVVFIAVGLYSVLTWGTVSFSEVMVLAFLFYRLIGHLNRIQNSYQDVSVGESAFWSLHEVVEEAEREREDVTGRRAAPSVLRAGIRFRDVDFAYGDTPVLRKVDLVIPGGELVAFIGPSGVGKTTLVDLLAGLHRPVKGEILVDDVPLDQVDLYDWRRKIGYVPQETLLFNDSIFRNVTLGNEEITRERVEWAMKAAGAWGFVSERREGLETQIGELGAKLSGGQRQRISIARALVRRPELLILDEATASLDPDTERAILGTLRELRGQVTIIAISHQPSLKDAADVVFEIQGGRVRASSTAGVSAP